MRSCVVELPHYYKKLLDSQMLVEQIVKYYSNQQKIKLHKVTIK